MGVLTVFGIRHYNGKTYELYDEYETLRDAQEDRDFLKRNGINVRIIRRQGRKRIRYATYVQVESFSTGEMPA